MPKSVDCDDIGEFKGYVVLLELSDVALSKMRKDEELGVDVLKDFGCLVCRKVNKLGHDEVKVRVECNLGEVVEVVCKVTCKEYALAVVGFYQICVAGDVLAAMLSADCRDANAVFIVEQSFLNRVGMELRVVFDVCPAVQSVNASFFGEIDVPICVFVIPKASCNYGESCGMVQVHMCDKRRLNAVDTDAVLGEEVDNGSSCINEKSVTVVLKIDGRMVSSYFGMAVACAEK